MCRCDETPSCAHSSFLKFVETLMNSETRSYGTYLTLLRQVMSRSIDKGHALTDKLCLNKIRSVSLVLIGGDSPIMFCYIFLGGTKRENAILR